MRYLMLSGVLVYTCMNYTCDTHPSSLLPPSSLPSPPTPPPTRSRILLPYFPQSTVAGLVTRGCREMATLAVALGGKAETLSGLSGVGDLMVREVHALEYLYK